MPKFKVVLVKDKVTPNTVRYAEQLPEGKPPTIRQVYLPNWLAAGHQCITCEINVGISADDAAKILAEDRGV
jgi:hypothetical protein